MSDRHKPDRPLGNEPRFGRGASSLPQGSSFFFFELLLQLPAEGGKHAFDMNLGGGHATGVFVEHRYTVVQMSDDILEVNWSVIRQEIAK
jgi:hypothetical protein